MATKNKDQNVEQNVDQNVDAEVVETPKKVEKLYVQSVVGRMVDCYTNKDVHEPAYHAKTPWLDSQMAAGKVVLADPEA